MQKPYLFIGIAVFMVIILAEFAFIPFKHTGQPEPSIALAPYIEFEGTVISLSLDESDNYTQGVELANAPNDSAVIRLDRIIKTGGFSNFDWASLGIAEGQVTTLNFKYTARPAKIITEVGETKQSSDTVSHSVVPTTITFEDGYFVFRIDGSERTEKILPGLKIGSKFKTKLRNTYEAKIEEYEIIS